MKVGITILNYNDVKSTLSLLKKIKNYKSIDSIIVVDNNSTDNSYQILSKYCSKNKLKLIKAEKNGGYSYGNNLALKDLIETEKVDIAIIANPDIIFDEKIITSIKKVFTKYPNCGVTSPIMLNKEGKPMRMWLKLPKYYNSILDCFFIGRQINKLIRKKSINSNIKFQNVEILPGSFLAFSAPKLKEIGYLDEGVFLYYEENIIGEKMKLKGYSTLLINECTYIHNHSISIKKNLSIINAFKNNLKSKLYYENNYHNINSIKEFILIMCMHYAVFEMKSILFLKSFFK